MKFSHCKMSQPPTAVSSDTGFMSINIQSGLKVSSGCYEFYNPEFILSRLSSSSLSADHCKLQNLLEAWNQSSETHTHSHTCTRSMKSKFMLQFFHSKYFLCGPAAFRISFSLGAEKKRDPFNVNNRWDYIITCNKVYRNKTLKVVSLPTCE